MNYRRTIAIAFAGIIGLLSLSGCSTMAPQQVAMEEFMVPTTGGLKVYVRNKHLAGKSDYSPDRVVLFVHGATYPAETAFDIDLPGGSWMDIAARRGFDTYMVDVRGYGRSERPATMNQPAADNPPFATTPDAIADVSAAVDFILKRRGIARLDLVGWSWGTSMMAGYTAQNSAKVNKLVLYATLWNFRDPPPISGTGHYRGVQKAAARQRGLLGIPTEKVEQISPTAWFDQWWAATLQSDPVGAAQNPPVLRAPNGVIKDLADYWTKGRAMYDPSEIRVPTMLILGEWDRETPLYMSQEVFSKMTNAPAKRLVVIAEGTHAIVLEKNRMELIRQIQGFLEE